MAVPGNWALRIIGTPQSLHHNKVASQEGGTEHTLVITVVKVLQDITTIIFHNYTQFRSNRWRINATNIHKAMGCCGMTHILSRKVFILIKFFRISPVLLQTIVKPRAQSKSLPAKFSGQSGSMTNEWLICGTLKALLSTGHFSVTLQLIGVPDKPMQVLLLSNIQNASVVDFRVNLDAPLSANIL